MKWEDLVAANDVIEGEVSVQGSIAGQKISRDIDSPNISTGVSPFLLLDLVSTFRDVQTSDARDKVYFFVV